MIKQLYLDFWMIERYICRHIRWSRWFYYHVPVIGRRISLILDRQLLGRYGIDLMSASIDVAHLAIAHPVGILLGGNGLYSKGRVAIMAGVKFVGRSPNDPLYLERKADYKTFTFGDNVVVGVNSVIVGPVDICDNVVIGSMSLVNRSITEPGLYVGTPVRRIGDAVPTDEWVAHLPAPDAVLSNNQGAKR